MTDSQIEHISKRISDLKDFENSIVNQTEFSNNPDLGIEYPEDGIIVLNTGTEQIRVENKIINGLINELKQQENHSTITNKKSNPQSELKELNNCQFEMSEEYFTNMFYARQISSGYGYYKKKLIEISKVFLSGKSIKYKEKEFLNIEEFTNELLRNLTDFKSIQDELRK